VTTSTGQFTVSNGEIFAPDGSQFVARGIDVMDTGSDPSAATLLQDFPGINFVRLAIYDYASPAALESYVSDLTSHGIVVELEDHTTSTGSNAGGSQGQIFSGQALRTELNWYSSVAAAFQGNPDVWFGTDNEPSEIDCSGNWDPAALSAWQEATYSAIRGAGNNSPVLLEANGWSNDGQPVMLQGYNASDYSAMSNTIWDIHYYGWLPNYSTDQATNNNFLSEMVQQVQQIMNADGEMAVLVGEYGNSTNGQSIDANGDQVINAVLNAALSSGLSSTAWAWGQGNPGDGLTNADGSLSAYGQAVAASIAAIAAKYPASMPGSGLVTTSTTSANDTVVKVGSTAAITDASGNTWNITSGGQVAIDGTTDTSTSNVIELAYVNGTIWEENSSDLWWGETQPNSSWAQDYAGSTSPLPTASANDTVVKADSTTAITDASGNTWTITSGGQVAVNGTTDTTTSNVIELAYVNGTIWEENSSNLWWGETQPNSSWAQGYAGATSPLPAASANDTVVKAGSTTVITDTSGNQWTITNGGQVAVNGTADTTTSNVIELAYVNGTIWEENSSNLWWGETQPNSSWAQDYAGAASPLPVIPSANDAVVRAGSSAAITDASGNKWTITSSGQVAVNGTVDTTTANVTELAYVNGEVWQENTSNLWWGKTTPADVWGPGPGTPTSPLPATTANIILRVSEDAYQGNAEFTVAVDGTQVGGTRTVTTLHSSGDDNVFVLTGDWATGSHNVAISFVNDAYGGTASTDRNLYVDSIAYNGTTLTGTNASLLSDGTSTFTVGGVAATTGPADEVSVQLSEDAYQGNAQFVLLVDGKAVTTPQGVVALHSAGAWIDLTFAGTLGTGSHTIGVEFTNAASGGTASTSRDLYVDGINVNGTHYGSGVTEMTSNGTASFVVTTAH
jgi:hypothetical protein